jgi:hypothetical protein
MPPLRFEGSDQLGPPGSGTWTAKDDEFVMDQARSLSQISWQLMEIRLY